MHFIELMLKAAPGILFHIPLADAHVAPHLYGRNLPALISTYIMARLMRSR